MQMFQIGQMVFWGEYHVIVLAFYSALHDDYHTKMWRYKVVGVGYALPPDGFAWVSESELDCAVLCFCPPVYTWVPEKSVMKCVCRPGEVCNGTCLSGKEVEL